MQQVAHLLHYCTTTVGCGAQVHNRWYTCCGIAAFCCVVQQVVDLLHLCCNPQATTITFILFCWPSASSTQQYAA